MSTLSERWQQVQSQLATKDRVHTFYAGATALWDLKLDQFGGRSIRCSMRYGRRHEPKELSRPPERNAALLENDAKRAGTGQVDGPGYPFRC